MVRFIFLLFVVQFLEIFQLVRVCVTSVRHYMCGFELSMAKKLPVCMDKASIEYICDITIQDESVVVGGFLS